MIKPVFTPRAKYPTDKDGWIDARCRPHDQYRMLKLMTEDGIVFGGWWTGQIWDGLHIRPETEIVKWKLDKES